MNGVADVVAHPQLQAGNRWTTATLPSGATVPVVAAPFRFASRPTAADDSASVPAVGAHTDELLEELGIR